MKLSTLLRSLFLAVSMSLLVACQTAEERAEQHFQSGVELLNEGDVERALVEFRNVFKLNGAHQEAREIYARTVRDQGKYSEAYSQYLLLAEQSPENLDARINLAELALRFQNWEEAARHGGKALAIAPDNPRAQAVGVALDYDRSVKDDDPSARHAVFERAEALKVGQPDNSILRNVIIDSLIRDGDAKEALAEVDQALRIEPDNRSLYRIRLQLLNQLDDQIALEAQLRDMVTRFPDEDENKALLIRYYMSRNNTDKAEVFLRSQVVPGKPDDVTRTTLVQFLAVARGYDAAAAELDALIAEGTNTDRFRAMRAVLDFEAGERESAVATLDDIISSAPMSKQTRDIKVTLAGFLVATGNEVGARALVEQVLDEDPRMVEALKMKAAWLIDADKADEAINALRLALDGSPENASVMTMMAQAHLRNGNRELSGELLSRAVEASNSAPAESMRYARFLISDQKNLTAEGILINALRLSPNNPAILIELGNLYAAIKDWPRAQQVEQTLRKLNTDQTIAAADQLRLHILGGQERMSDALSFLEGLAGKNGGNLAAQVAVVRARVAQNDVAGAMTYLAGLLQDDPENPILRFVQAAVFSAAGDFAEAETVYRALIRKNQTDERLWLELIRTLNRAGDTEKANAVLDEALAAVPDGRDLLWAKATFLEQSGDIDGAIGIYQTLYDQNTSTSVIANNLASLLSVARDDPASLERAYAIARRLRGTGIPAYQDTYGWIAYRRGDFEDALRHLKPSAAALSQDPVVQYHLAATYAAMGRDAEALDRFQAALALAKDSPRREFDEARSEVDRLQNGPSE